MRGKGVKLIGIGGGGCNGTRILSRSRKKEISCVLVDTCWQSIEGENADGMADVIGIGAEIGKRLGADQNPGKGYRCAMADRSLLEKLMDDTGLIFLRIALGGGTGSGAGLAFTEMVSSAGNIAVVGLLTMPFSFEARNGIDMAEKYRRLIVSHLDIEVCISNDAARKCKNGNESINDMFQRIEQPFQSVITDISMKFEEFGRNPMKLKGFLALKQEQAMLQF